MLTSVLSSRSYGLSDAAECAVEHHNGDKALMTLVVNYSGHYLKLVSNELKKDVDVVSVAVERNGCALEYASEDLRSNKEIVEKAIKKEPYAYKYIGKGLENDEDIAFLAVSESRSRVLHLLPPEMRDNAKICKKAVSNDISSLEHVSKRLKDDPAFMLELLSLT